MADDKKIDISSGPVEVKGTPVPPAFTPPPKPPMPAPKPPMAVLAEPKLWQVTFKSGQGEQVPGTGADVVRGLMEKRYGKDYEIVSILPVVE